MYDSNINKHLTVIIACPKRLRPFQFAGSSIPGSFSPYDKIWGIGMEENDPGIEDPANWKGLNLLGHAIMTVRSLIIFESYNTA